jgi:hypothetical protein
MRKLATSILQPFTIVELYSFGIRLKEWYYYCYFGTQLL